MMEEDNMDDLNIKLAKWVGFKEYVAGWQSPNDGRMVYDKASLPYFTESLDACMKWLIPKLQLLGHTMELEALECKGYKFTIFPTIQSRRSDEAFVEPIASSDNDSPAMAVCNAIEQFIDKGK